MTAFRTPGWVRLLAVPAFLALAVTACNGGTATTDGTTDDGSTDMTTDDVPAEDDPADTAEAEPTDDDPAPAKPAPAKPAPATPAGNTPPAADAEDGTHPGYLVVVEAGRITVDRIEILSGDAAATARAEDGEPPVEPGLDVPYLRNRNPKLRTVPVAADVRVRVHDCSAGCQLVTGSYADLVAGKPLPYGSPDTPFEVTVRGGEVVELVEVYLP